MRNKWETHIHAMEKQKEKLKHLSTDKLIDVVKNYRQYGYDEAIRDAAIALLESRDIDMESLKLRGDFTNTSYEEAVLYFNAYKKQSATAFIAYILAILLWFLHAIMGNRMETLGLILELAFWMLMIAFMIAFIKSLISRNRCYKIIGKEENGLYLLLFFLFGMPAYIILYFVLQKQMKEDLKKIK
ncbi:MAG: hypothetical protein PHI52_07385 [Bacteroidales bacterium]|nr:hypothetical protein [Bacteroidales bacterium]